MMAKIDKYGRLVISKEIRKKLNLEHDTALSITVKGDELILRARRPDLEKKVEELEGYLSANAPKPFTCKAKEGVKWLTEEYCLKKLGLLKE